jgi:signal transduction histidine kinase
LGRRLDILFPGDRRDEAMAHIQRAVSGERWEVVEIPIIHVDGTVRTVLWNSATLFAPDGTAAVATIAQGQDITDRKRSELLLRKANAEIEQFLYTASHDLKSPLVTIQGFLGYMANDTKAGRWDRMAAYTERVQAAAGRMARLIDDLLKFSHIGRIAYEPADIDLTELVGKVVSAHGQELAAAGISVVIREDLPPLVGDMDCIQQVFDHLLANAIKYGSSAAEPRIEIGAERHGGEIRAFVKDNGKGIPPEYHEKIFNRLGHDKQGVGVGLAIVKRIVEMHGGRVWVESAEGRGATFWLGFPPRGGMSHPGDISLASRGDEE